MAWTQKVLRVNLTDGSIKSEPLNMEWAKEYLGQRGLATKYLVEEIDLPLQRVGFGVADFQQFLVLYGLSLNEAMGDGKSLPPEQFERRVVMAVGPPKPALLVPKDALVLGGQTPRVFVIQKDSDRSSGATTVRPIDVQLGIASGNLIEVKGPAVLKRNFKTNFALKHMYKDLGLILSAAEELQVPIPMTGRTMEIYGRAIKMGLGEKDFCSVINYIENLAGKKVKGKK